MVSLKPCFSVSAVFDLRKASSSVMSASSNCVTCGIITQLRCRFAPESFLMRERGFEFDRAELGEIHVRPGEHVQSADALRGRRRAWACRPARL